MAEETKFWEADPPVETPFWSEDPTEEEAKAKTTQQPPPEEQPSSIVASVKKGFLQSVQGFQMSDAATMSEPSEPENKNRIIEQMVNAGESIYQIRLRSAKTPEEKAAVEEQFGREARTKEAEARFEKNITGTRAKRAVVASENVAETQKSIDELQEGPAMEAWDQAESTSDALKVLADDPLRVITGLTARGLGSSVVSLAAGTAGAVAAGPVGMAAGVGSGSFATEQAGYLVEALSEEGVDMTDPVAITNALQGGAITNKIRDKATKKGLVVGAFDAVSAGFAGKIFGAAGRGVIKKTAGAAGEVAMQAGAGAAGEAAGSAAAGDEISGKAVIAEAAGEILPGVAEAGASSLSRRVSGEPQNVKPVEEIPPPPPESPLKPKQENQPVELTPDEQLQVQSDLDLAFDQEDVSFAYAQTAIERAANEARITGIVPERMQNAQVEAAKSAVASYWTKYFTGRGDMPQEAFDLNVERVGRIQSLEQEAKFVNRNFFKAIRDAYNISPSRFAVEGYSSVPQEDIRKMDAFVKGQNVEGLDPTVMKRLRAMRRSIDRLSSYLIDKGMVNGELKEKISDNIGVYLTRSYRIFDDPKWLNKIESVVERPVINKAKQVIWTRLKNQNPDITEQEAWNVMRATLEDWVQAGEQSPLFKGGKIGSKDLSMFMKRGDIDPAIRAVMGEYTDPVTNYTRSLAKISRFIANQEFLNEIKKVGLGKWLFEDGKQPEGFDRLIAAKGTDSMSPLNGYRTTREIAKAFETVMNPTEEQHKLLVSTYLKLNAASKVSKTVGSLLTQLRNLYSQPFFNTAAGHFNFSEYKHALKTIGSDIGVNNHPRLQKYYRDAARFGILNESTQYNELRDVLRDASLHESPIHEIAGRSMSGVAKKIIDIPLRAYRMSDELGKLVGWENEKAAMRRAYPNKSEELIKSEAAKRVRNTYPTYSMVPEWVKALRKVVVIGPFVSFPYEVTRTFYHNLRYGVQDIKEGRATGNKALIQNGINRLAGTTAVVTMLNSGLAAISAMLFGISDEDEEDIRKFLPPWQRNSTLIYTGRDGDNLDYLNWSYMNPFGYLTDSLNAALNADEEGMSEAFMKGVIEYFSPYLSAQMLAGAIADAYKNVTESGGQVYNPEDPDKEWVILGYLIKKSILPGTIERINKRIIPAFSDQQPEQGQRLDPWREVRRELSGIATESFNFSQAIWWASKEFRTRDNNAEDLFRSVFYRRGTVTPEQITEAFIESDKARFNVWQDMHAKVRAAGRHGVTESELIDTMRSLGIAKRDAESILRNEYIPMAITKSVSERAAERKREIPAEIEAYRESRMRIPLNTERTRNLQSGSPQTSEPPPQPESQTQ